MAKSSDEEVGFSGSTELVLSIDERSPPPGEELPTLLSKMQLNPGPPKDSRKEAVKSMEMVHVI